jgi:hypothetical protein
MQSIFAVLFLGNNSLTCTATATFVVAGADQEKVEQPEIQAIFILLPEKKPQPVTKPLPLTHFSAFD